MYFRKHIIQQNGAPCIKNISIENQCSNLGGIQSSGLLGRFFKAIDLMRTQLPRSGFVQSKNFLQFQSLNSTK
jgi:hypothetical protein